VTWRAFPLHPDTPEQGLGLDELFKKKGIPVDVDKMMAQLKTTAAKLGLELGDRKKTYNSRLAQELDRLVGAQPYEVLEKMVARYAA
jgi:predicted DsbA family dithiol-disulfide isomerase